MRVIDATMEYAERVFELQLQAYGKIESDNITAKGESLKNIESRIKNPSWKVFIGVNKKDEILASISCLLNNSKDVGYISRWCGSKGTFRAIGLYVEVIERVKAEKVKKLFARTYRGDRRADLYRRGGFRAAKVREFEECASLIKPEFSFPEGRIYLVKKVNS